MKKFILLLVVIFFQLSVYTQVGISTPWAWMKGSNQIASYGHYGLPGVEDPANNPFSRSAGSTFKDLNGNLWLFGGYTYLPAPAFWMFQDLWKFNPSTNNWTLMKGSDAYNQAGFYGIMGVDNAFNQPGSRSGAASWTDGKGDFWLFGGDGFDRLGNYGTLNDLWKFDISTNNWTWVKGNHYAGNRGAYGDQGVSSPSNLPASRSSAVTWQDANQNLWLFGGYDNNYAVMNDVWRYNIQTNEWTWMKGSSTPSAITPNYGSIGISSVSNTPPGRSGAIGWVRNNSEFFMFGGSASNSMQQFNDLWKYSPVTNEWTWLSGAPTANMPAIYGTQGIPSVDNRPGARSGSAAFTDLGGDLWLFGGGRIISLTIPILEWYNDLWKYTPGRNEWTWMKGGQVNAAGVYGIQGLSANNNRPGSRSGSMSWSDRSGNFWLFAGVGYDGTGLLAELNDLWKINGLLLVPVKLISFTGRLQGSDVLLQWNAAGISPGSVFVVERSVDGTRFEPIGNVIAVSQQQQYYFSDQLLDKNDSRIFYRLKITEQDNSYSFSKIVPIEIKNQELVIYPNPAFSTLLLALTGNEAKNSTVTIFDLSGRILIRKLISSSNTNNIVIDVSHLAGGPYQLKITSENNERMTRFIKN
jgi:N-acetylneuraminic acid mutarotase